MIFARKIKIPEFYTIFVQKMPEFYIIIGRKIFFLIFFGGGGALPAPVSYAYVFLGLNRRPGFLYMQTRICRCATFLCHSENTRVAFSLSQK